MGRKKGLTAEQWSYILVGLSAHLMTLAGLDWAEFTKPPVVIGTFAAICALVGGTLAKTSKDSKL